MNEIGKLAYKSGQSTLTYIWTIDNFQYYFQRVPTKCLVSPVFSTPHSNHAKQWRIRFHPRNPYKGFENYSSIFLQYFGEREVVISFKFSFASRDASYFPPYTKKTSDPQLFNSQNSSYGFQNFLQRNDVGHYNTLTIACEISFDLPLAIPETVQSATIKKGDLHDHSLQDDFQGDFDKLFESELLSDVVVNIGQKKKSLHKAILASRSEVFQAMFQHDMTEKEKSVVDIVDIKFEVAMEMFRYIYTGKANNHVDLSVDELLIAAEKYAITGLKTICENTLCQRLNFDTALQYLTLASVHNSIGLKTKVMEFIVKYLDKFVDKPEFKSLDQSILCELFSTVAKKKNTS